MQDLRAQVATLDQDLRRIASQQDPSNTTDINLRPSDFKNKLKPLTPLTVKENWYSLRQKSQLSRMASTRAVCEWNEKRFTRTRNFHTSIHKTLYHKSAHVVFRQPLEEKGNFSHEAWLRAAALV
ncbi:hypothetical protein GQ600_17175 [Phytophthora cactorum]|nr:hypothetical protein GQ600_17175 [Phytophthora cactorum]